MKMNLKNIYTNAVKYENERVKMWKHTRIWQRLNGNSREKLEVARIFKENMMINGKWFVKHEYTLT